MTDERGCLGRFSVTPIRQHHAGFVPQRRVKLHLSVKLLFTQPRLGRLVRSWSDTTVLDSFGTFFDNQRFRGDMKTSTAFFTAISLCGILAGCSGQATYSTPNDISAALATGNVPCDPGRSDSSWATVGGLFCQSPNGTGSAFSEAGYTWDVHYGAGQSEAGDQTKGVCANSHASWLRKEILRGAAMKEQYPKTWSNKALVGDGWWAELHFDAANWPNMAQPAAIESALGDAQEVSIGEYCGWEKSAP